MNNQFTLTISMWISFSKPENLFRFVILLWHGQMIFPIKKNNNFMCEIVNTKSNGDLGAAKTSLAKNIFVCMMRVRVHCYILWYDVAAIFNTLKCHMSSLDPVGQCEWCQQNSRRKINIMISRESRDNACLSFLVITVPADGLAPWGARVSAGTVMTLAGPNISSGVLC